MLTTVHRFGDLSKNDPRFVDSSEQCQRQVHRFDGPTDLMIYPQIKFPGSFRWFQCNQHLPPWSNCTATRSTQDQHLSLCDCVWLVSEQFGPKLATLEQYA